MRGRRQGQAAHEPVAAIAAALVWRTPLPDVAGFEDLCSAVSALYGRRLVFDEIKDTALRATTGILFEAETFTGILVPADDSNYYSFLSRTHELCHLIVRSAPDDWFPPGTARPHQPAPDSRLFLRLCPRNSSESNDAESVREELIVEEMARMFTRRLSAYADTTEEEHFG
ncbi:hypothetical protein NY551_18340 [Curtobacterium flaccumfaciens pv. oortii]|uniref:hypothetical protein n=1 Tax=Curtobacterium flaccumfaciens TaxID=2035 RepID=UPI00265A2730|nr:hypothetical protein [Curtobacterium flaccumfaciens]MCS5524697.1 hypothetical protein [Curtobacterium flaccumfaciens pv. oortii]